MAVALAAALSGIQVQGDVVNWPSWAQWQANPLYASSGVLYGDVPQDTGNNGHLYLDYVGDSTYAAGYLLYRSVASAPGETEDHLFIRLRLNTNKRNDSGAYQILFETDGDDSVEWAMQLAVPKQGASRTLTFGVASGTNRNGVTFGTVAWTDTTSEYLNYSGTATDDGTTFDRDADYFLDLAMPWAVFSANTGIASTNEPFRVILGSSQLAGSSLDGDVGNSAAAGDVYFKDIYGTANPAAIPEPAVLGFISLFGIGLLAAKRLFRK